MSLDQRARNAAAELRDGLERRPQRQSDAVIGRARRRHRRHRRTTRALAAAALATVVGVGAVVVAERRQESTPIETTDDAFANLPDGAQAAGRWAMVPKRSAGLPVASSLSDVASIGTSFLLAGGAPTAAIWRSDDGLRWQQTVHPNSDGQVQAIATAGDTALAVGTGGPLGGGSTFVWRSNDGGRTWSDIAVEPDPFGPPAPDMGRPFVEGLVHAEGWWIAHGGASDGYAGAWVSRDGRQWSQVLESGEAGSAAVVTGADQGLFAYWVRLGWFTTDPTAWGEPTELSTPDGFHPTAVAEGASLAVGTSSVRPGSTVLLRSADGGRSWRTDETFTRQFPEAWLFAVHRTGLATIVAGASGQPNHPAAWMSDDDGRTWTALPPELAGPPGGTLGLIATAGPTTLLLGTAPELDRYYILHNHP